MKEYVIAGLIVLAIFAVALVFGGLGVEDVIDVVIDLICGD